MKAVSHPKRKLSIKREIIKKKLLNIKSIGERYNNKNEQKNYQKDSKANFKWEKETICQLERLECRPMEIT